MAVSIEDIEEMWEKDCEIDGVRLDTASLDTPKLQNKYLKINNSLKLRSINLDSDYNNLLHIKSLYYSGKLSKEELEEKGWEPYPIRVLRNDLKLYYESDKDLKQIKLKIEYNNIMIKYLEGILDQLSKRTWMVSNAIKWKIFTAGE